MQYDIINYSHHAVCYIPMTSLFYNWKFVIFVSLYPCHCLLKEVLEAAILLLMVSALETPRGVAHQTPLSWDFPGKNTRVGCHFLLQRIFSTQGLCLCLLHCRQSILYPLSHQGSPFWDYLVSTSFKATPLSQGYCLSLAQS